MTISRAFTTAVDQETGFFGFMPRNMVAANAGNGESVAHDTMEHIYGWTPAPVVDELLAIGAATWLRFLCPWRASNGREMNARGIGATVGSTLIDAMLGARSENEPWSILMLPASRPIQNQRIEDVLVAAAERGVNDLKEEAACILDPGEIHDFEGEVDKASTQSCVLRLLRRGYRHARKRYYGIDPYEAGMIFTGIAQEVDDLLRRDCTMPGIDIKVAVSPTRRQAKISIPAYLGEPVYVFA